MHQRARRREGDQPTGVKKKTKKKDLKTWGYLWMVLSSRFLQIRQLSGDTVIRIHPPTRLSFSLPLYLQPRRYLISLLGAIFIQPSTVLAPQRHRFSRASNKGPLTYLNITKIPPYGQAARGARNRDTASHLIVSNHSPE